MLSSVAGPASFYFPVDLLPWVGESHQIMDEPAPLLQQAVEDYIGGDDSAGDRVCGALEPEIRSVVRRVLSPSDADADDVVQDSLVAVLGYLRRSGALPPRNIEAFACTVARNRCVNLLVWRQRRHAADVDRFAESIPDIAASPLQIMEESSARALVDKVLARLDQQCRALLESIYRSEVPIEELRGSLGLNSVQAVYYRKDVCIRKAQKILNQMLLRSLRGERGLNPETNPE